MKKNRRGYYIWEKDGLYHGTDPGFSIKSDPIGTVSI